MVTCIIPLIPRNGDRMNLTHDSIKIKYIREGYLPNYPYHMISDEEMCNAFMNVEEETGYFFDNYPLLTESLKHEYDELVKCISSELNKLILSNDASYEMPDWVYSYMLGSVISVNSDKLDIHDMLVLMGIDNIDDEFLPEAQKECLRYSKEWVNRANNRPPTIFGEPHVIKSLRLMDSGVSSKG